MNRSLGVMVLLTAGCTNEFNLGNHASSGQTGNGDGGTAGVLDAGGDGHQPAPTGKLFFVTDGTYSGDLAKEGQASSGVEGADAICNREAKSAGKGGTFRAWVSTPTKAAKDRIQGIGPWFLANGTRVFAGHPSQNTPIVFPAITASGADIFFSLDANVWTGTLSAGTATSETCAGWASASSDGRGTYGIYNFTEQWTEYSTPNGSGIESASCASRFRLYCFEQ